MKYAPKKVFIIKDGGYQELTYEAYCALCESDSSYKDKRFLPLHGMLMEVTEDDFKEFYRNQRRQKYLEERSINNQDISIAPGTSPVHVPASMVLRLANQ